MLDVTTTTSSVKTKWDRFILGDALNQILAPVLRRIGLRLQATMMRRINHRGEPWQYGHLNRQTATLQRSLFYRVVLDRQESFVRAGVDLLKAPYGRIQELGGVSRSGTYKSGPKSRLGQPWSIRIRPAGYIASSLQDEQDYINAQGVAVGAKIAQELGY